MDNPHTSTPPLESQNPTPETISFSLSPAPIPVDPAISPPPPPPPAPFPRGALPTSPSLALPPLAYTSDALVDPSLPPAATLDNPHPQQPPTFTPPTSLSASTTTGSTSPTPKTPRPPNPIPSQTATPLPPPPSSLRRLTDFEKGQIAALWDEYHSISKIQQKIPRPYNTIKSFVDRWTQRGREHKNVRASGRPLKVKGEERRRLQLRAKEMGWDGQGRGGRERWKGWEELRKEVPGISLRTLKRVVAGVYDDEEVERANEEIPE